MQPLYMSGPNRSAPEKAHDDDAAFDLMAAMKTQVYLGPFERALIPCGFRIEIPEDYVGLVCPRSGMALSSGITVLNAPGVIDPSYRGQVGVILINLSDVTYTVKPGDRIAQLLIVPNGNFRLIGCLGDNLTDTHRGINGFGSTGP